MMRFWDAPIKYSVNTFWFIPTIIALLLKLDRGTNGIEYAENREIIGCVGTAALNPQIKRLFQERYNILLYESYGLSETLFVTTNYPGDPVGENSVGSVLEDVDLAFSQDNEILIDVPWMFLGYLNVDAKEYFENGKFRSGDLGTIDKQGSLVITGRKKDLIIRGGTNISPKRIEDFISTFNVFEEIAIVGSEDINLGEKIACFFVPKEDSFSEDTKKELNMAVIKELGSDYRIDEFVRMDAIPKTTSGKVDKQKLKNSMMVKGR
jgi:long-chain acyl-CoA synthetase